MNIGNGFISQINTGGSTENYNSIINIFNQGIDFERAGDNLYNKGIYDPARAKYEKSLQQYQLAKNNLESFMEKNQNISEAGEFKKTINKAIQRANRNIVEVDIFKKRDQSVDYYNAGRKLFNDSNYSLAVIQYKNSLNLLEEIRVLCDGFLVSNPEDKSIKEISAKNRKEIQSTKRSLTRSEALVDFYQGQAEFNKGVDLYNTNLYQEALGNFENSLRLFNNSKIISESYIRVNGEDKDFRKIIIQVEKNNSHIKKTIIRAREKLVIND